ncbi:MAG: phosphoribosylamine--glycine ligase [Luteitalea sp.]|nr:phosphoribosylamine--glycine ligase [Luteitalea sp.]
MRVLVVGSGAREHALVWKLAREASVEQVLCAPGNPGVEDVATCAAIDAMDVNALVDLARRERIDLTVVGPEQPLERGVADAFGVAGLPLFGPTKRAARLETSKAFAKQFMTRHGVPTARGIICHRPAEANDAVAELGLPVAIKVDGLAAGKGVTIATDLETARVAIAAAMVGHQFGDAGRTLVVEEFLTGTEVSCFALCDGERAVPLVTAQDHKRLFDRDRGPNTGGMGAFAPSPHVTDEVRETVMRTIVRRVIEGMAYEGDPFRGILYCGLMLTATGPRVVEFNVRFGDPEAQVVLPLVDAELAPLMRDAAAGALMTTAVPAKPGVQVGVVLASGGYPGQVEVGLPISGLDRARDDLLIFHAGTRRVGNRIVTAAGRVLTVVAGGPDFAAAIERVYDGVGGISFHGMQYRKDIGKKALRPL